MNGREKNRPHRQGSDATDAPARSRRMRRSAPSESERRYAAIFEASPFAIALVRVSDLVVVDANAAFARLFELTREDVLGKAITALGITGAITDAEARSHQVEHLLAVHGAVRDFEMTRTTRSGATVFLALHVDRVMHDDARHVLVTIRDLTDLRRAEERARTEAALRRAEAKYAAIVANAADAIISIDERGDITEWNKGAEQMFGYSRAEALGTPLHRLLPERHRAAHERHVARFAGGAEVARKMDHLEATGLRKGGEEFPISAMLSKIQVGGERILTVSVRDVTEERRAQAEQRLLADVGGVLASLEYDRVLPDLMRVVVGSLADYATLFVLGGDGSLCRAATASRDPSKSELVQSMMELSTSPRPEHPVMRVLDGKMPLIVDLDPDRYEIIAESPDHLRALRAARPTSALVAPLLVAGKCVGVLGLASASRRFEPRDLRVAEEVARRCALYIENARLHDSEKRAIQVRDEVLGVVAHDLRSPLNAITIQVGILRRVGTEPVRSPLRSAEAIDRVVTRMGRIIDDLVDITQLESGHVEISRALVPARDLLSAIVDAIGAQVASRSLELRLDVAEGLPEVSIDSGRLLQVFDNLVGNALKFTAHGAISLGAKRLEQELMFWVGDTGAGIAPNDLPHLFDRFWQAHRNGRGSAGLGLAIVKSLVEAHGGRIWVESRVGSGSTFFFTIPIPAEAPSKRPPPRPASPAPPPPEKRRRPVLVAEDDPDIRLALTDLLSSRGYDVAAVTNGREALEHIKSGARPDAVILDLMMPVMDGWTFLGERSRDAGLSEVPVIVLSAQRSVADRVAAARARYLQKPVSPEMLFTVLADVERSTSPQASPPARVTWRAPLAFALTSPRASTPSARAPPRSSEGSPD